MEGKDIRVLSEQIHITGISSFTMFSCCSCRKGVYLGWERLTGFGRWGKLIVVANKLLRGCLAVSDRKTYFIKLRSQAPIHDVILTTFENGSNRVDHFPLLLPRNLTILLQFLIPC